MPQRDDCPEPLKRALSARVGNLCSNPDCRALTSGPHKEPAQAVNLGVAAHITAPAPGGPRYDAAITPDQRGSVESAIWLCQNCAKLIDNDPARFSVELLQGWRASAEEEACERIGRSAADPPPSAPDASTLTVGQSIIGGVGIGIGANVSGTVIIENLVAQTVFIGGAGTASARQLHGAHIQPSASEFRPTQADRADAGSSPPPRQPDRLKRYTFPNGGSTWRIRGPSPDIVGYTRRKGLLDAISEAVRTSALVALQGPGGVGKTTLASAVANSWRGDCYWTDARDYGASTCGVAEAILTAFGKLAHVTDADSALEIIQIELWRRRKRKHLIVIDNADAPDADFWRFALGLAGSPKCRVLVTSRVGHTGRTPAVKQIDVPGFTFAEASDYLRVWLDDAPQETLTKIANKEECVPLLLRIAASQLRARPLDIDRYLASAGGLQFFWDSLSQDKRCALLAASACSATGFSIEALAGTAQLSPRVTEQIQRQLCILGLLEVADGGLRIHPLIREYVRKQEDFGHSARRHAAWVFQSVGADRLNLGRIAPLSKEVMAAVDSALEFGLNDALVQTCLCGNYYWRFRGPFPWAITAIRKAIDICRAYADLERLGPMLYALCILTKYTGPMKDSLKAAVEGYRVFSRRRDPRWTAFCLEDIALHHLFRGRLVCARSMLFRALTMLQADGAPAKDLVLTIASLGRAELESGRFAQARARYEEALHISQQPVDGQDLPGEEASAYHGLALVAAVSREAATGLVWIDKALQIRIQLKLPQKVAASLWVRGRLLHLLRRLDDAESTFDECIEKCRDLSDIIDLAQALRWSAELKIELRKIDIAMTYLREAETLFKALRSPREHRVCRGLLVQLNSDVRGRKSEG
jgi:tetratricopeptide (TPR) repeat protein